MSAHVVARVIRRFAGWHRAACRDARQRGGNADGGADRELPGQPRVSSDRHLSERDRRRRILLRRRLRALVPRRIRATSSRARRAASVSRLRASVDDQPGTRRLARFPHQRRCRRHEEFALGAGAAGGELSDVPSDSEAPGGRGTGSETIDTVATLDHRHSRRYGSIAITTLWTPLLLSPY